MPRAGPAGRRRPGTTNFAEFQPTSTINLEGSIQARHAAAGAGQIESNCIEKRGAPFEPHVLMCALSRAVSAGSLAVFVVSRDVLEAVLDDPVEHHDELLLQVHDLGAQLPLRGLPRRL